MKLIPKTTIQFDIDYTEDYQWIEEPQEIELTNGYAVSLVFTAEVDIAINRGLTWYDETEYDTSLINPSVDILEVWDENDVSIFLSAEQEKQLKKELLNNL